MRTLILFFFCAVCSVTSALAQVDSGAISGVITDTSGAVVPGATVTITQTTTNITTVLTTNETGFYSAPSLRPGDGAGHGIPPSEE